MNPATIIREAQAGGVKLALSPAGTIKASGDKAVLERWLLEHGEAVKRGDVLRLGPAVLRSKSRRDEAIERLEAAGLIVQSDDRLAANPSPTHLRQRPPAKTANHAKTRMDRASAPCESFAKVANESANAQADIRAIRKHSQAFANDETRMDRAFSQHSQLSQTPLGEGDANDEVIEVEI